MINENLKSFLDKLASDADLADKLSACKSADEAFAIASEVVGGFTKEEFVEAMTVVDKANHGEISREDLSMVAGGDEIPCSTITTVTTATAIPITAGAAGVAAI